eukprot:COSAG02_NODE_90_length_37755_cov_29.833364_10_plen_147_part_00
MNASACTHRRLLARSRTSSADSSRSRSMLVEFPMSLYWKLLPFRSLPVCLPERHPLDPVEQEGSRRGRGRGEGQREGRCGRGLWCWLLCCRVQAAVCRAQQGRAGQGRATAAAPSTTQPACTARLEDYRRGSQVAWVAWVLGVSVL